MSEPVKKKVRVVGAQYNHDSKSIVLKVEEQDKQFLTQIGVKSIAPNITNWDSFSKEQMKEITSVFCSNILGKEIFVVSDLDLDAKLKEKYPLNY